MLWDSTKTKFENGNTVSGSLLLLFLLWPIIGLTCSVEIPFVFIPFFFSFLFPSLGPHPQKKKKKREKDNEEENQKSTWLLLVRLKKKKSELEIPTPTLVFTGFFFVQVFTEWVPNKRNLDYPLSLAKGSAYRGSSERRDEVPIVFRPPRHVIWVPLNIETSAIEQRWPTMYYNF